MVTKITINGVPVQQYIKHEEDKQKSVETQKFLRDELRLLSRQTRRVH
jgi:hypothetical protein